MQLIRLLKIFIRSYLLPRTKTYSEYSKKGLVKNTARYCYSIWLRHMVLAYKNGFNTNPKYVAEIGPGDSLGTALCALLTGVKEYTIIDSQQNIDKNVNYQILDDLVLMFQNHENIPDEVEFPKIRPLLDDYNFPKEIFDESTINNMLKKKKINQIKNAIDKFNEDNSKIKYIFEFDKTIKSKFDLIISQAVLEHIDDLDSFFIFMKKSLKKEGYYSHQIDLKSHNIASSWDGHWRYSDKFWRILRGKRLWFINRYPMSFYINLLVKYNFRNHFIKRNIMKPSFNRSNLAKEFRNITEEDRETSGFFIQGTKKH